MGACVNSCLHLSSVFLFLRLEGLDMGLESGLDGPGKRCPFVAVATRSARAGGGQPVKFIF